MRIVDLGRAGYLPAWEEQKRIAADVMEGAEDTLVLVEHDPVLTLGASFHEENLLFSTPEYAERGIEVVRTDRGGDVTYHGPGQLVLYPIFDLKRHGQDLHKWMRDLEEAVIVGIRHFGLEGWRFPPHTGVWLGQAPPKKVAAIGVKVKRWVSLHGIALNCAPDVSAFDLIVPCGIVGYGVTSLSQETSAPVSVEDAKAPLSAAFCQVFG
ncbi:MAG: lipoyl(octanoyl) transferase LipB [Armatimonadetes bacterium]|nr:lipoyl(octanoyl) transferase LipB [Armatimonadota bacterium]